ncbi:MAG: hypothetical protein OJK14_05705 [Achromobacter sp.]|uniref:hypothetical protein n=1 Tax=Achromobacter sp. TaxID=134375 RepID=UPI002589BEE1|nr:hypothetical protein [Achromobacter sp.]MCW0206570.1 hypothetical protein [Achromobacter sp.]
MKRFSSRAAVAALALAMASAPAMAGGGYRYGYGHGGGYHHHHGGGSSTGWWVGGAFALAAVGLMLAADSGPSYVQTGVYAPGVVYTSPPVYAAPVYDAPLYEAPPVYAPPQAQYAPVQYEPAPRADSAQASATTDCRRWAMNQSGYDPATISQWTTQVMVDTYNRMLDSCMTSRGYRKN